MMGNSEAAGRLPDTSSGRSERRGGGDAMSRSGAFVSVVVHDDCSPYRMTQHEKSYRPSKADYAKLLSFVYALLVMILGLIFPIAEALSNVWLESPYIAAFLTYLTSVGAIFIVYLQFYLLRKSTKHKHGDRGRTSRGNSGHASTRQQHGVDHGQTRSLQDGGRTREIYTIENGLNNCPRYHAHQASATARAKNSNMAAVQSSAIDDDGYGTTASIIDCNGDGLIMPSASCESSPSLVAKRRVAIQGGLEVGAGRGVGGVGEDEMTLDNTLGSTDDLVTNADSTVEWMDLSTFGSLFSHECSNLYLRLGALLFGMGNIIYYVLEVQNVMVQRDECGTKATYGWTFIPRLVFVVVQTFFLFKGTAIEITQHQPAAWFGLMHLVATNACLWFRTVVHEIAEEFKHAEHPVTKDYHTVVSTLSLNSTTDLLGYYAAANPGTTSAATFSSGYGCDTISNFSSNYLFPIVLEYSLTAIGALISFIQSGLGRRNDDRGTMTRGFKNLIKVCSLRSYREHGHADDTTSVHTDGGHEKTNSLAKSHIGLFFGILMLVISLVSAVLFHIYTDTQAAVIIYLSADIIIHACLLTTCFVALVLTSPLAYRAAPVSGDDMLLLLSMIGSVLFEVSLAIPSAGAINNGGDVTLEPLYLTGALLGGVQSIVQTLLIVVSLRRYPSESSHVTKMPGRGSFGFLIIGNVSVWLLRTLANAKGVDFVEPNAFYGKSAWLLIMNINFPLLLFFRFHSSVCFADVWHLAYVPLHSEVMSTVQPLVRAPNNDFVTTSTLAAQRPRSDTV